MCAAYAHPEMAKKNKTTENYILLIRLDHYCPIPPAFRPPPFVREIKISPFNKGAVCEADGGLKS